MFVKLAVHLDSEQIAGLFWSRQSTWGGSAYRGLGERPSQGTSGSEGELTDKPRLGLVFQVTGTMSVEP